MLDPASSTFSADFDKLLADARGGSKHAIVNLIETYHKVLYDAARRAIHPGDRRYPRPSDLFQDLVSNVIQHFGGFQGDSPAEFESWLRRIMLNLIADFRRAYRRHTEAHGKELSIQELPPDVVDSLQIPDDERPHDILLHKITRVQLDLCMSELCQLDREIVMLHFSGTIRASDIAKLLNMKVHAVRQRRYRALRHLARLMKGHNPEE